MNPPTRLRSVVHWSVPAAVYDLIVADCLARRPDEACGLLIGRPGRIERALPLANVWPEPAERAHRFTIDPLTQAKAEIEASRSGVELVGFYHSHPTAAAVPSRFDAERAWPVYAYVIVGLSDMNAVEFRAWGLDDGGAFVEHAVSITRDEKSNEEQPCR